jgi:ABC-type lipoprotein export system ATPase subunit
VDELISRVKSQSLSKESLSHSTVDAEAVLKFLEGITTIIVTHEPDIAVQAKRLVKFKDGRIVYDGPVTDAGMSA